MTTATLSGVIMKALQVVLSAFCIGLASAAPGSRIIGGYPASIYQYPFAAAIEVQTSNSAFFCGGTLYTQSFVITAGQCVNGAKLFTVRLGSASPKEGGVELATSEYILHPDFDPLTLANDIGLIKFRLPVSFTDAIRAIQYFPNENLPVNRRVRAIGWGQTDDETPGPSSTLNYVYVTTLTTQECRNVYGDAVLESMVCVEGNYNEGACYEDTGSPLVDVYARYHDVHVGISSFFSGNGCESTDPSGYTRTEPYVDWIKNVTSA